MEGSSPSKLVLLIVLLAPLLEARTLGGFYEQLHQPLTLPSDGAVLRRHKLNEPGGSRPPHVPSAPMPKPPYHPQHEPHGGSAGVSRRHQHAPPPPKGHTPPSDPRTGPPRRSAGALRVLGDAIQYVIGG